MSCGQCNCSARTSWHTGPLNVCIQIHSGWHVGLVPCVSHCAINSEDVNPLTFFLLLQHKVLLQKLSLLWSHRSTSSGSKSLCESIHHGILHHSLLCIWKCTIDWALFVNESPTLWLKLYIFWNVHFLFELYDSIR
jgi:hypothetical protein